MKTSSVTTRTGTKNYYLAEQRRIVNIFEVFVLSLDRF